MSVPAVPVTVIRPLVASGGTVTVMLLLLTAVTAAGAPLNRTDGLLPKLNPLITTGDPAGPRVGLNVVTTVGLFGAVPESTTFFR